MAKVLIAEDEERMRALVSDFLKSEGHQVFLASNGEEALQVFFDNPGIELVVLDVMMPGLDGWVVLRTLRSSSPVRVIMLTARGDERDELLGYQLGVDEYVHKPFSPRLLMARVNALLRRSVTDAPFEASLELPAMGLTIDRTRHRVLLWAKEIELSPRLFGLLVHFARHPGIVMSREQLLATVWGADFVGDERTVDTHIKKLRDLLGPERKRLQTIRGFGYRLEAGTV